MRRERAIDIGIALGVFALTVATLASGGVSNDPDARSLDALGVVLAALARCPSLRAGPRRSLRSRRQRRRALRSTCSNTARTANRCDGRSSSGPTGNRSGDSGRLTAVVIAFFFLVHVAAAGYGRDRFPVVPALFGALVWGAWVGDRVRLRRTRCEPRGRARQAERETVRERRLAAAEERTRIARDSTTPPGTRST